MAKPTTLPWYGLGIWPGDGASPEDFTSKACGINATTFGISKETADSNIPDCDDPSQPGWTERVVRALSSQIQGEGFLAQETFTFWQAWALDKEAKQVRVVVDWATTPGFFQGAYHLTNLELNGTESDGKVGVNVTLASDGPVTYEAGDVGTP